MTDQNENQQPPKATSELKGLVRPCPFCGGAKVSVHEGSSFRWRYASCDECGASSGEIRCQTLGTGTKEKWEKDAENNALKEWNTRA